MAINKNLNLTCHICERGLLTLMPEYSALSRVASDCVPWPAGGRLGVCENCHCVQNPVDEEWHTETKKIYGQYKIYRQSAGSEQGMFTEGKNLVPRSSKVLQQALPYLNLTPSGRLLDIGCANGELLKYFGNLAPHWKMVGFEIDDKTREEVEKISGVEAFASGSLKNIQQKFDIITLIHVFEHLPSPVEWLQNLKKILNPSGTILIQVPDPKQNPFNLLVADHCSHFLMSDLEFIAKKAGFRVITQSDQWVPRELSILLQPDDAQNISTFNLAIKKHNYPEHSLTWLNDLKKSIKNLPKTASRGIWGTAIAATWVYSVIDELVDFFVDEDARRIGQMHLNKPIYSPDQIPQGSQVFIALTPDIAKNIFQRWAHLKIDLHIPLDLKY